VHLGVAAPPRQLIEGKANGAKLTLKNEALPVSFSPARRTLTDRVGSLVRRTLTPQVMPRGDTSGAAADCCAFSPTADMRALMNQVASRRAVEPRSGHYTRDK
jgi:hypothetical protein